MRGLGVNEFQDHAPITSASGDDGARCILVTNEDAMGEYLRTIVCHPPIFSTAHLSPPWSFRRSNIAVPRSLSV